MAKIVISIDWVRNVLGWVRNVWVRIVLVRNVPVKNVRLIVRTPQWIHLLLHSFYDCESVYAKANCSDFSTQECDSFTTII